MKKLMAVLMSTALFCSFALFTACSDKRGNGGGKLDGDFSTEATDDGVFSQISADFDIKVSVDLGDYLGKFDAACSGYVCVKAYDGTVELPDDLDKYTEVNEVPSFPTASV